MFDIKISNRILLILKNTAYLLCLQSVGGAQFASIWAYTFLTDPCVILRFTIYVRDNKYAYWSCGTYLRLLEKNVTDFFFFWHRVVQYRSDTWFDFHRVIPQRPKQFKKKKNATCIILQVVKTTRWRDVYTIKHWWLALQNVLPIDA